MYFFFQAEDGIRDIGVTGVQTCALPIFIFKGEVHEMKTLVARSRELGMQTFDQALFDLFEADMITYEDALRNADSVNDIRLKIKLESKNAKNRDLGSGMEHLEIVK